MTLFYRTFSIMMPHPELGEEEETFECTFEGEEGCPQTDVDPGEPASFEMIEAYATVSGPVNRVSQIPADEIKRVEDEMLESLEEALADDFNEPDDYPDDY